MSGADIRRFPFTEASVEGWTVDDARLANWPVVYVLDRASDPGESAATGAVYVGETRNAAARMRQHLASDKRARVDSLRVILDPRFNKSACLDLESHLIRWFSGDGALEVLNRNDGITDADYYDRSAYRGDFREVFERLRAEGLFSRSIPQIENSDLFKLSPFKALTESQAVAVDEVLEALIDDLGIGGRSLSVIAGEPGTGKTVIAIYLLKLISDIQAEGSREDLDPDSRFAEFFENGSGEILRNRRVGFVVPQQSLRASVKRVFRKTPGLHPSMVLTPFEVGAAEERFDLLIVDEAHRLNQRANQPSGPLNARFRDITTALFGADDVMKSQLDWIRAQSDHQILLVDAEQTVRPADLPRATLRAVVDEARRDRRFHPLTSQMRVRAGDDYVGYIRELLAPGKDASAPARRTFGEYELRIFDDLGAMRRQIERRDAEVGLSRLVAGYAWPWRSKSDPTSFDIEVDGERLRWNSTQVDWIASEGSRYEVGSIHTVQGYDLNYAGVIIGPDLGYTPGRGLYIDRDKYFDAMGKQNNKVLGIAYSDDDLLRYIANVYAVLLTRGVLGTYVYVCDPGLREYLAPRI